ncbi:DNA sulfur modification protein DndD [Nodosilinea sp. LEGE 06152]|uniref:DNA sulfur modification protein DndD n=1 Tax=Nodosilinea sp. LEGE 06152 TaxID=2777966 RepID=UPI001881E334|nr:DNA sulfur modification protein DndD [Nodosilinea sp. LEGE 06152]MBE9158209.1 DNA sulfur modification protein DndD [Nodosilinea sp. LEGE 06152]MBE9160638.1 DNA sulfur modification protein DndD [Nodosilinea sp. LEGE 06152]
MIFLDLTLENFGPYYGQHSLNLRLEAGRPIILIGGLNGGGKTTLMDAIRLALYGQRAQIDRRRSLAYVNFLTQCVNNQAASEESAAVELTFEHVIYISGIEKLGQVKVRRTWQRGRKDTLTVELDGWPNEYLTQNWDEQVEDWLPLGLSNLFLFDGEQVKALAEQDTPPPSVVSAIRAVLGLELADRLANDLAVLVSRKQAELGDDAAQQQVETLRHQLTQADRDLSTEAATIEQREADLAAAETAPQEAEDRFFAGGGHITEQAEPLQQQVKTWRTEIKIQTQALHDLAASVLPLAMIQGLLIDGAAQGQREQDQQKAAIAREALVNHDQRLLDLLSQLKLKPIQKEQIEAFMQQESQSLITTATGVAWLEASDDSLAQLTHILQHQLANEQQLTQTHLSALQQLNDDIDALEGKPAKAASAEDYETLKSARNAAQTDLKECQMALEIHRCRYGELERQRQTLQKALSSYGKDAIADSQANILLDTAPRVQATLAAFREKLTEKKLSALETQVTQYLKLLLHKASLVSQVMIDPATFRLDLYDTEGAPLPIQSLSAGEKQLLAISFLWGLANSSGRQLPVAIDTPLGRLDSEHRNHLVDSYFPQASHQVILLSTDTEIRAEEVDRLRGAGAISREYMLEYDPKQRQTAVVSGYFW